MLVNAGSTSRLFFKPEGPIFSGAKIEFLSDPICRPNRVQPSEIFGLICSDPPP